MTAPFITVGRAPARSRIQPIMPVTVDLPLVPPMPIARSAALNSAALRSARVRRSRPSAFAAAPYDRKSVVLGKGGDVTVHTGGCRELKKKKQTSTDSTQI